MEVLLSKPVHKSISFHSDTCKRCGSDDLFTEPAKPPHYLALRCRSCGLFVKFISKEVAEQVVKNSVRADLDSTEDSLSNHGGLTQDTPHLSCAVDIDYLNKRIASMERELAVLMRAILACGVLQGKGAAPSQVDINDDLVDRFVQEVAEDQ